MSQYPMVENGKGIGTPLQDFSEPRKFARDIVWFGVAQLFVSLILGVVALPALTKSHAPEIYGIWVQMNVTVDLVSPLVSLQLGLAANKFLAGEENKEKIRRTLGSMLSAIIVFGGAVSLGGLIFAKQLSLFVFNDSAYASFASLLVLWVLFNSVFNFLLFYLRARSRIKHVSIIQIVVTALKMAAILFLAGSPSPLQEVFIAMVALQFIFTLYILFSIQREIGLPLPNLAGLRRFLAFSLPQVPVIGLLWVIGFSDRYFITHFLGLSQNGIYSSSSMVAALITLFYMPISFVLLPHLFKLWRQKRSEDVKNYFESSLKVFLTLAIPAAIGITIVSQPLLRMLSTSEFLAGRQLVFLLSLGAIFLGVYHMNTSLILMDKQAKWLPIMTASACMTSIVMNVILVPRIGIIGAAISNCASYFVLAAITTVRARKTIAFSFKITYFGKVAASATAMLVALAFLSVNSGWGMVFAMATGLAVFAAGLLISRAFSNEDMQLVARTLGSLLDRRQPRKRSVL